MLSTTMIVEKIAERVREHIANGNNSSTYIGQPVPVSYRNSDRVTEETLTKLVGNLVRVTENYNLRILQATFGDRLSRSQIHIYLTHP